MGEPRTEVLTERLALRPPRAGLRLTILAFGLGALIGLSPWGFPGPLWEANVTVRLHGLGFSEEEWSARLKEPGRLERIARTQGVTLPGEALAARMRVVRFGEDIRWSLRTHQPSAGQAMLHAAIQEVAREFGHPIVERQDELIERRQKLEQMRRRLLEGGSSLRAVRSWSRRSRETARRQVELAQTPPLVEVNRELAHVERLLTDPPEVVVMSEVTARRLSPWPQPLQRALMALLCGGLAVWLAGLWARPACRQS